jgi:shikimate kinase
MKIKKNLVLLGMMGVGKTRIGKYVARRLKINFFDIDKLIEKKNEMKIAEIFKKKGEIYFRKEEEFVTIKYLNKKESIISLGGGGFINNQIRKKILSECISVWLNINLETIYKRLKNSKKRPLIYKNNQNNIGKIFLGRKKIYSLADHEINCDNLNIYQISNKIIKLYEEIYN